MCINFSGSLIHLVDPFVLLEKRLKLELLEENDAHEEQSKDAIAKVAEHVVEVTDKAQRFPGQKKQYIRRLSQRKISPAKVIVVTYVLVSRETLFSRESGMKILRVSISGR